MPIVDKDLYFVIDEKNNQVDLHKGVEYMSQVTKIHNSLFS
jgi:preprotein translocase subunit SecA